MDNCLGLLGLAKKAGILEIGDDKVTDAAGLSKVRLIMSASDASPKSAQRAEYLAEAGGSVYIELPYTKEELGAVLGRGMPGMLAITDVGMAESFVEKLAAARGGYDGALSALKVKKARAEERRRIRDGEGKNKAGKRRTKK